MNVLAMLTMAVAAGGDPHQELNPVYRELRLDGIVAGDTPVTRLPEPTIRDDMDAPLQKQTIAQVVDGGLQERFFRDSVNARHVLRMQKSRTGAGLLRTCDFWFVAFGELTTLASDEFLDEFRRFERDAQSDLQILDVEQLQARGISLDTDEDRDAYAFGNYRVLKRVLIQGVFRSYWSETDRSILVAAMLDQQFKDDRGFPNRWYSLTRDHAGREQQGDPVPYEGAGLYVKFTRLEEPAGALLAEGHIAFIEPDGWFRGHNLLGSKLPAMIQSRIRETRKGIKRAAMGKPPERVDAAPAKPVSD